MRWPSVLAFLSVLLSACGGAASGRGLSTPIVTAPLPDCSWALVTRVVDGDTIVVQFGGKNETVRYIGMDTPETVKPGTPVQPFGPEASVENKRLVEGKQVCLEKDVSERDQFGRLLRDAWLPDGTLVGEALVLSGLAQVSTFPPDVKYVDSRLLPAQRKARVAQAGMWAGIADGPSPPAGIAGPPACFQPGKNSCDCKDFTSHAAAQAFHDAYDSQDTNRLDSNGDGVVCESLP